MIVRTKKNSGLAARLRKTGCDILMDKDEKEEKECQGSMRLSVFEGFFDVFGLFGLWRDKRG